jgi:putative zinc finger/helix-turn-helix YgiT family protein
MPSDEPLQVKKPIDFGRPFPWRCGRCGEEQVELTRVDYDAEVRHDGRLHSFQVPDLEIPVCRACGERVFTEHADEQINDSLRSHLRLLMPAEIRAALRRVGLKQKVAAEHLGVAEATLSRWLTGTQIQSRAMDNLLRVFFEFPEVRTILSGVAPLAAAPRPPRRRSLEFLDE